MKRTAINPSAWGAAFEMNQGEVTEGETRRLRFSGQAALVDDLGSPIGVSPAHAGDMAGQMRMALGHIDAILEGAGMGRENLVQLRFYTTDPATFLEHYEIYAEWIAAAGVRPPQSLLGVAALALPELMVEIEAEAAA